MEIDKTEQLYSNIKNLLLNARKQVLTTVNSVMTLTYYEIGRQIVEEEQNGKNRASYGKELLKNISKKLTVEFGKGFSERNLRLFRKFYQVYSVDEIWQSMIAKSQTDNMLSWTHYIILMRIDDIKERKFYEIEAKQENWTVREMERQIDTCLYQRLSLSRDKKEVLELSAKGQIIEKAKDLIKEPYILEFLGLEENPNYSENDL